MTDKQIIIDGVDVSGCVHLYREIDCLAHMDYSECCEGYDPSYGYCPKTDCYYKQLKRAEQRIVELNKTIQAKEQEGERMKEYLNQIRDEELSHLDIEWDEYETSARQEDYSNIITLVERALGEIDD